MNKTSRTTEVLIYISFRVPKGQEKEYSAKQAFEKAIVENIPNLAEDIDM